MVLFIDIKTDIKEFYETKLFDITEILDELCRKYNRFNTKQYNRVYKNSKNLSIYFKYGKGGLSKVENLL